MIIETHGTTVHCQGMAGNSPLDDTEKAAFAWARYRRMMRTMLLFTIGVVVLGVAILYKQNDTASAHYYIAAALGIAFTMLLTSALMGLVFLSSGTGHDEAVENRDPEEWKDKD